MTSDVATHAVENDFTVGFITDVEGNISYFERCVELSQVVCFDDEINLQFMRPHSHDIFVFGGDLCDKGPGDIRITKMLLDFKENNPDRVHLLAGNRDINKIRVSDELRETKIEFPYPVPPYPGQGETTTYREYLMSLKKETDQTVEELNTRANRLRWMLDITLGAKGMFEHRQTELSLLNGVPATEEDVVNSYIDSVEQDDGFMWRYLQHAEMAYRCRDTLFVHGGIPGKSPGWVPPLSMPWALPQEGMQCPGECLPDGHTLDEWIAAMNLRLHEGLYDYRQSLQCKRNCHRGGEVLLVWQSTPACYRRSVVVESALTMGTPAPLCNDVEQYLVSNGIRRVVSGHKPCGDSPFVLRHGQVEVICCDTTYSDPKASDKRGAAAAAVEIIVDPSRSRAFVAGILRDKSTYAFKLPPPGEDAREESDEDARIGCRSVDGWWIKAKLQSGAYHCAQSTPGSRTIEYCTKSSDELVCSLNCNQ